MTFSAKYLNSTYCGIIMRHDCPLEVEAWLLQLELSSVYNSNASRQTTGEEHQQRSD